MGPAEGKKIISWEELEEQQANVPAAPETKDAE